MIPTGIFLLLLFDTSILTPVRSFSPQTGSSLSLSSNHTNDTQLSYPIPAPPPDLITRFEFDTTKPLNPLGVYLSGLELMFKLSLRSWTDDISDSIRVSDPRHNVQIILVPSPGLQTGYAIHSFARALKAMYDRGPGFYRLITSMELEASHLGFIDILPNTLTSKENTLSIPPQNETTPSPPPQIQNLTAPSQYTDPVDPRLAILYNYHGRPIPMQELFLATIDALATVAQYPTRERCVPITGISPSAKCVFQITETEPVDGVLCVVVARALYLVVRGIMVRERRFQEMGFELVLGGLGIGKGDVFFGEA